MSASSETGTAAPARLAPGGGVARPRAAILFHGSPLARRIVALNLVAILLLVAGMAALNPFRDTLVLQRETALVSEAELVADVFEAALSGRDGAEIGAGIDPAATIAALDLAGASEVFVFDRSGRLMATSRGVSQAKAGEISGLGARPRRSLAADLVDRASEFLARIRPAAPAGDTRRLADRLLAEGLRGATHVETALVRDGAAVFAVATPIRHEGRVAGVVAMTSGAGEIDALLRAQLGQLMELAAVAVVVSIGLSLVLASAIATPLAQLSAAAETGRMREAGRVRTGRIRIPDMTARPDEIGRLSGALRGMVSTLYDRIDANEQFAADVTHEIRNPLASLRSAAGALRVVGDAERRARLLDVIDHDVRRLDRLVTDISDASRLDSDLVREEEEPFDLGALLGNLSAHLGAEARGRGIDLAADLPAGPLRVGGLESRLAQVFVNLIGNAVSFCPPGGRIDLRARRHGDRVRVTVTDTGPGIPDAALSRIFERFYSERPEGQFGNNSGLGLAISKQIVEAHGGAIWAENITPPGAGPAADPIGARFVVDLPA